MNMFLKMVSLLAIVSLFGMSSLSNLNNEYEKLWKTLEQHKKDNLPKSALKVAEQIYDLAKKEKNSNQSIKALMHIAGFTSSLEEEGYVKFINLFEAEIASTDGDHQKIVESLTADVYWNYIQRNLYRIKQRTQLAIEETDVATWSLEGLVARTSSLYRSSVADVDLVGNDSDEYSLLLTHSEKDDLRKYKPSLYLILVDRALGFSENGLSYVAEPINAFVLSDPIVFGNVDDFVNAKIESNDKTAMSFQSLLIYQECLRYLKNLDRADLMASYDLQRLKFARQHYQGNKKDILFLNGIDHGISHYRKSEEVAQFYYEKANYYRGKGSELEGKKEYPNPYFNQASDIAEEAMSLYGKSNGALQCKSLVTSLNRKEINVIGDRVALPGEDFLLGLQYRNIDNIHYRAYRSSPEDIEKYNNLRHDHVQKFLKNKEVIETKTFTLSKSDDLARHHIDLPLNALSAGSYIFAISDNPGFRSGEGAAIFTLIVQISDLAAITILNTKVPYIKVVNRKSGIALEGARVEVFRSIYDQKKRQYVKSKAYEKVTDKDGFADLQVNDRESLRFVIHHDDQVLDTGQENHIGTYREHNQSRIQTFFFTDRSIYRPGQTVYFKTISIQYDNDNIPSLIKSRKVLIEFLDANSQKVSDFTSLTNDFGSVNGTFTAPNGGLLGRMSLRSSLDGYHQIRVEEYKRPKFAVKIDKPEGEYKLSDTVKFKGHASALAGNAIDGAQVTYRITREAIYPHRWWGYRPDYQQAEIAHGALETDDNGSFEIDFIAIPGSNKGRSSSVNYNYKISVDVTDINGETRTGTQHIIVGEASVMLSVDHKDVYDVNDLDTIGISLNSLNGQAIDGSVTIKIQSLTQPRSVLKKREWSAPDVFILDSLEFIEKFPRDIYSKSGVHNWPTDKLIIEETLSVSGNKPLQLRDKLKAGVYKITLNTKDKDGVNVMTTSFFSVTDKKKEIFPNSKHLHLSNLLSEYEPGDVAKVNLGTPESRLHISYVISRRAEEENKKVIDVSRSERLEFPVSEMDRGGFYVTFYYVIENRIFEEQLHINVPWSNKELDIELTTFRDELLPGQDEEWSLTVKADEKKVTYAEVLASMYDASLDQFTPHNWSRSFYHKFYSRIQISPQQFGSQHFRGFTRGWQKYSNRPLKPPPYIQLNWFGMMNSGRVYQQRTKSIYARGGAESMSAPMGGMEMEESTSVDAVMVSSDAPVKDEAYTTPGNQTLLQKESIDTPPTIRENLNETVFFFPDLHTDKEGNLVIKFKMNESLTKWRFMTMAHTTDLKVGYAEKEVQTKKDLMVVPNPSRFLREGDEITLVTKVVNLTEKLISGKAEIKIIDPWTDEDITSEFGIDAAGSTFSVDGGKSGSVSWKIRVPDDARYDLIKYQVMAKAGKHSDGEVHTIPVLTNRKLVTETMVMSLKGNETKNFTFKGLSSSGNSNTLKHNLLSLDFTSNPVWYAVQALPYLAEYPYDCTEQLANRLFANMLASHIANANPRLKKVFDNWKTLDSDALLSNLQKNQELKSALLEETPWVLQAKDEESQKKNIALLFDLNRMSNDFNTIVGKLVDRQMGSGGFPWFKGDRENVYISQYVAELIGHLDHLGALNQKDNRLSGLSNKLITYMDEKLAERYERLKENIKDHGGKMEDNHLDHLSLHYLYARSFYKDKTVPAKSKEAYNYYLSQVKMYWKAADVYSAAWMGLILHRGGEKDISSKIARSLDERTTVNDELGQYYKSQGGYYWHQLPLERHSTVIELFDEIDYNDEVVDNMKIWLIKNKQTNRWPTTKATSAAIYALLMSNEDGGMTPWIESQDQAEIRVGGDLLSFNNRDIDKGTGYVKKTWQAGEITEDMSTVNVVNPNDHIAWGGMYWQYFEDLDKIDDFRETPLTLKKELYLEEIKDNGPSLTPIDKNRSLTIGDKIVVRVILKVDRPMEFLHMKDMRSSGFEPINVLSRYKWQDGLGYYESTRDASTDFFISSIQPGTYVFEYPLRVQHEGVFSNGITTIQSMYAPEFSSHSRGEFVEVK